MMQIKKLAAPVQRYTQEQMQMAFKNVQSANWKDPIKKMIDNPGFENLECLREAIIHFTGSVPSFTYIDNEVLVVAAGYYATIGA